ncbi:MAG: ABC transporter permease [Anaerolineae bacterium]|nr:ABC transporter permease [Anaerolineae bacterium]
MTAATDTTTPIPAQADAIEKVKLLSVRRLMWLRFKRNRLAVIGGVFLIFMYTMAIFADFIAPYGVRTTHDQYVSASPHGIHFIDAEGQFHLQPFVYGLELSVDPKTFRKAYTVHTEEMYPVNFLGRGETHQILGIFETDIHLFTVDAPGRIFLLGTDQLGRDLFSRVLYGARISLSVGLVGVTLTLILGSLIGVMTGYFGGWFDDVSQRIIEVLLAFPQLPLWLALASVVPPTWSSVQVYFAISIVLSILNWGALARQVRGMVYALREEDYVVAARYTNCSNWRIIRKHLLPNTLSHILVIATLAIPNMILGETALSFLGLGIRPPMTSWGLLLNEAQNTRVLLQQPWLLTPAIFVVLTIISFNFLGDGIRDAADPFSK